MSVGLMLSEKNQNLYRATYQTMIDRLHENGYAQTSLTGAYEGMFVRDASIQVMAHTAQGDYCRAKRILQYMAAYHKAMNIPHAVHVMDSLSETGFVNCLAEGLEPCVIGDDKTAFWVLSDVPTSSYVVSAAFKLMPVGQVGKDDKITATLYKGDVLVDEVTHNLNQITDQPECFLFCLPLADTEQEAPYSIRLSASRPESVCWLPYEDANVLCRIGVKDVIQVRSPLIQVDGLYMWVNAYALFSLVSGEEWAEFVKAVYPQIKALSSHFLNSPDHLKENGLLRNPVFEHTRRHHYWETFDLTTNVFASEALHKMSLLAKRLGDNDGSLAFSAAADSLAKSIHEHLVVEMDGVRFYGEMIGFAELDGLRLYDDVMVIPEEERLIPGFSWVNLAPMAAEWYAVDATLMANTYAMYRKYGTEIYHGKYPMLVSCREFDETKWHELYYNHVIGKGLSWEIRYLWEIGDMERLETKLNFIDEYSDEVYPETWVRDGRMHDSANQEQASWMLYEMARITGRFCGL